MAELGRLRYIEPTNFFNKQEGTFSDAINFPYEDYNMAIDLSIRRVNRYSCGWWTDTGDVNEITYSSKNGTISFLGGTKYNDKDSFLTSNFTDISMVTPEVNTSECLGIESINISYNSWLYPQVVVKFVDVRGATVMQPIEREYFNPNDAGVSSEIYKSLFSFPYPIFTLKIKGFYGKGVTYKLAVHKTDFEFDANTGNFNITVEFIGYMFGIYADIPMTYIAVAPYTEVGSKYWERKKEEGIFKFKDANGNNSSDMLKIPELRTKLAQIANNEESAKLSNDNAQYKEISDKKIETITNLIESFPFKEWFKPTEGEADGKLFHIIKNEEEIKQFKTELSAYTETVKTYDEVYNKNYTNNYFYEVVSFLKSENDLTTIKYESSTDSDGKLCYLPSPKGDNKDYYEEHINKYDSVKKYIDENMRKDSNKGVKNFYVCVFSTGTNNHNVKNFINILNSDLNLVKEEQTKEIENYKKQSESLIEKVLGFKPSIKNIYDLMFAHMDTFMHCFYTNTKIIKKQLDSSDIKRKKSYYEIKDGDTDTEREIVNSTGGTNNQCSYLPPYAAYYKKVSRNNVVKKELRWPKELPHGEDLEELNFVIDLLNAAELYYDDSEEVDDYMSSINSENEKKKKTTILGNFIPLNAYDFVYKDTMRNPYESVRSKINKGNSNVEGEILGIFAIRAFYYLLSNSTTPADAKAFGRLEALNLFKAVNDNYNDSFVEFIKKFAESNNQNKKDFIDIITTTAKNKYTEAWRTENTPNLNKNLFKLTGDEIDFNYHNIINTNDSYLQYEMFPLYFIDFNDLKNKYINNDFGKDFIHIGGDIDNSPGHFYLIEDRDYILSIYNTIEMEVKNARNAIEDYGDRKDDEYGKLKNTNRTLKNYFNNIEDEFNDNVRIYKNGVVLNEKGKEISKNKVNKLISKGTIEEQQQHYIQCPTSGQGKSVFEEELYLAQDDILMRACLFLQSIPLKKDTDYVDKNGLSLKVNLLKEGSYYWWSYNYDKNPIKSDNLNVKIPSSVQCFRDTNGDFRIIHENEDAEYRIYGTPESSHDNYSRYICLLNYFEKWAKSTDEKYGFAANEERLRNRNLYKTNNPYELNIEDFLIKENGSAEAIELRKLQSFLRDLFFGVCTTINMYNGIAYYLNEIDGVTDKSSEKCPVKSMENAFKGFMQELSLIYKKTKKDLEEDSNQFYRNIKEKELNNPFKNTDIRLSTYMTLKSLYDKWLCSPYNGPEDTWTLKRSEDSVSDFDNFIYADSFYHDIGYQLNVNISKITSWLNSCIPSSNFNTTEGSLQYTGRTLYEFLTEVAQDCGGMLMVLPQKFGLNTAENIKDMFRPISIQNDWDEDTSTFLFIYTYKPSEHLASVDTGNMDMNGWSIEGDGIDLTDEEIVGSLFTDSGYTIPSFAVTYAKQNQSIFKSIRLNTTSAGITEAGLAATYNIASKASESPRETTLYGQDLYRVFSNYSYQCEVETMGNMQITPLMYFQLNNIPMWKGAYMIKKVTHNITAGNISTNFEGVRLNKYAIPIVDGHVVTIKETGDKIKESKSEIVKEEEKTDNTIIDQNSESYNYKPKVNNSPNNGNIVKENSSGETENTVERIVNQTVSKQKPIICLTPAHGPKKYGKTLEYNWSCNVIKKIIDILTTEKDNYKYHDGTFLCDNVYRCNKEGKLINNITMEEARTIIKKYGSENVISIVPHWNGGGGNRFECLKSRNPRKDSIKLMECMVEMMKEVKANRESYTTMPKGAMDKAVEINFLAEGNNDEGPTMNCACMLTENWFADYPPVKDDKGKWRGNKIWATDKYEEKDESGRYKTFRGWLESDKEGEGLEVIARAHVKAIKKYIDNLQA